MNGREQQRQRQWRLGACDFLLSRPLLKTGIREVGRQANRQAEMPSEPAFLLCDIGHLVFACKLR